MPILADNSKCCGCAACANRCPKNAISMCPGYDGFLYPFINKEECIECKACEKVCPAIRVELVKEQEFQSKAYIVQFKDDLIRFQSTSGGAFTAIAMYVIDRGGIVFGAAMTDELKVHHTYVDNKEDLFIFRNSKYVQSEIGNSYRNVYNFLMEDKYVCFSGTPCQIDGLCKFLGKKFNKLILVDVVCKSVPSPMVFDKYKIYKQIIEKGISDIVFRDKKRGFLYCTMAYYKSKQARLLSQSTYRRGSESDEWLRLFLSGKISRESCFTCKYQSKNRLSDFTLGDIWETGDSKFDDDKGCTLVHVWTDKGNKIINELSNYIQSSEYPIEKSRGAERVNSIKPYKNRKKLFYDANTLSPDVFFKKYAPNSLPIKLKQYGRFLLWKINLQSYVRHIKHLIIHRKK